jgi:hypothetical protein
MKTALALVPAAVILLAGCSSNADAGSSSASETTVAAGIEGTATPGATSSTDTPSETTASATSSPTTSPASVAPEGPEAVPTAIPTTFTDVNQTINDPDLKQSVTVKRIARQLPWPQGYKASAQAYELVGVEMTWTPSKDYTIPISKGDFSINTGSQFPNNPDPLVDEAVKAAGWTLLPDKVDKGDAVTGWLIFKVDPRNAPKLVLDYNRPAVKVTSGGSGSFPAKTSSVTLVG